MSMSLSMVICRHHTAIHIHTHSNQCTNVRTHSNYQPLAFKDSLQGEVDNGWVLLQVEVIPRESLTKRNQVQTKFDRRPQGEEEP